MRKVLLSLIAALMTVFPGFAQDTPFYSSIAEIIAASPEGEFTVDCDLTIGFRNNRNIFVTDGTDFIQIYGSLPSELVAGYKINKGWTSTYTLFQSTTPELVPVSLSSLSGEKSIFTAPVVKGSEISTDMVNSVVTIPDVYFASTTGGNKTNFDGTADGVTLSFRNNYNLGQVGAGYYDVTVVVNIYNGAVSLYVINYALPSVVVDDIIYIQTSATDAAVSGVSIDKASLTKALIHETVTINGHELNVTSINDDAFSGCELKSVTIADATTSISCNQAFSGTTIESLYLGRNWSGSFSKVHNVTLGAQVTSIPKRAFEDSPLSEISIPATVETIGNSAFSGCAALESVNLNDGLTRIGNRAFSNCTALTQIEIPATVETVGHPGYSDGSVFDGCTSLETLIIADGDTELSADFSCPS